MEDFYRLWRPECRFVVSFSVQRVKRTVRRHVAVYGRVPFEIVGKPLQRFKPGKGHRLVDSRGVVCLFL